MTDDELRVSLPVRFKEQLNRRFDVTFAEAITLGEKPSTTQKTIRIGCPLCVVYRCPNCPFGRWAAKYGYRIQCGCWVWLCKICGLHPVDDCFAFVLGYHWIDWKVKDQVLVEKQMQGLRDRAEQLITWTD